MTIADLTRERVLECVRYDPDTGEFTRIKKTFYRAAIGQTLCSYVKAGYSYGYLDKTRFALHRLAFFYMNGEWPMGDVDHINGQRSDNRWANLRLANRSENLQNQKRAKSHNVNGFLGVSWNCKKTRYVARIHYNGKTHHIGVYDSPEEAHAAYVEAKRMHHPMGTL